MTGCIQRPKGTEQNMTKTWFKGEEMSLLKNATKSSSDQIKTV